jgi:hypothetical protein
MFRRTGLMILTLTLTFVLTIPWTLGIMPKGYSCAEPPLFVTHLAGPALVGTLTLTQATRLTATATFVGRCKSDAEIVVNIGGENGTLADFRFINEAADLLGVNENMDIITMSSSDCLPPAGAPITMEVNVATSFTKIDVDNNGDFNGIGDKIVADVVLLFRL